MAVGVRAPIIAIACLSACSCSALQLGFPRVPVSASSPDGRYVAIVRNHPDIDPPSQTIWVGPGGGSLRQIQKLGPDSDWCDLITWSADSSTVAFLVQDARLITVDAASQRIVSERWLTPWKGEYPPYQMVVNLSLSAAGGRAQFRTCNRNMNQPGYVHDPSDCGPFQVVQIKPNSM